MARWAAAALERDRGACHLATVGCGWVILQPGMGAGIAASNRPNANTVRLMNIAGHTVFAIGLYGTALLTR